MGDPIPSVARHFITLYNALPIVNFPFTKFNISFALLSALFLTCVRCASEFILQLVFGWPLDSISTTEAASGCSSICHSTILCTGLIIAFRTQAYDVAAKIKDQAKPNEWWPDFADSLLQFCTGYMIYDAIVNILWLRWDAETMELKFKPDDYLFLAHHMMTSFYMISARIVGAGYMSAMICMLLGEITNPLQNLYMIAGLALKLDCCNGAFAQSFHAGIEVAFAAAYFCARVIVGPPFLLGLTYVLMFTKRGRANVPIALNIIWNILVWGVCIGSASWIQKCYGILSDFASGTQGQAEL